MSAFLRVAGDCGVRHLGSRLDLELWGRRSHAQPSRWNVAPLELEVGDRSARILGARALEWLIDLLVIRESGGAVHAEVWRVSPYRILRRWRVGSLGPIDDPAALEVSWISEHGFRLRDRNHMFLIRQPDFRSPYSVYTLPWYDFDVFISFKDKEAHSRAELLCKELEARDLRVWFSPHQIGTNYDSAIAEGIEASASYAIIWSKSSGTQSGPSTGRTPGWSQSTEIERIDAKTGMPKSYCVLGKAQVPALYLRGRYHQVKLDVVGEAAFADMILGSFKMKA